MCHEKNRAVLAKVLDESACSRSARDFENGLLESEEFDPLHVALKTRKAIVHGLMIPSGNLAASQYIVSVAGKLLSENGQEGSEERTRT